MMTSNNDPRLDDLKSRLSALEEKDKNTGTALKSKETDQNNMRLGLRAGTELIAAIIVGTALGYYLDKSLGTKPIFLIALLILGVITGFVNVWRTTQNIGYKVGYKDQLNEKTDQEK